MTMPILDPLTLNKALDELLHRRASRRWMLQVLTGPIVMVGGVALGLWLLQLPVVSGRTLGVCFLIVAGGGVLLVDGKNKYLEQENLRKQIGKVREGSENIVDKLVRMKKARENVFQYLADEGFSDPEIREYLLKCMKGRMVEKD